MRMNSKSNTSILCSKCQNEKIVTPELNQLISKLGITGRPFLCSVCAVDFKGIIKND